MQPEQIFWEIRKLSSGRILLLLKLKKEEFCMKEMSRRTALL